MKAKVYYNYRYDRVLSGKEKLFATHQILTIGSVNRTVSRL